MSRVIVHLSDLHFNWVERDLIPPLLEAVAEARPDLVCVSGDFTQHAWPVEFEEAAEFLKKLPGKLICVPGNHDMAFLNPVRRITQRLRLYKKYITSDALPFYADEEIAVLGLNTSRVSHLRDGRIRTWQVDLLEEKMKAAASGVVRILVTHHPFDLPESFDARELLGRGGDVLVRVAKSVDMLLAGHMHISHAGPTAERFKVAGHSAVFVQAGTAISIRSRGEPNAFQVIQICEPNIDVQSMTYEAERKAFVKHSLSRFKRSSHGWARVLRETVTDESVQA